MKEILTHLFQGKTLDQQQASETLTNIASGKFSDAEIASFLTVFQMRKITPVEFLGFRDAMLGLAVKVDLGNHSTIDVCGTGGDGKNTFNISTLSAFVLAGAGAKVVKHGNYGLSSACGSSNIFEHFGYQFSTDSAKLKKELDDYGLCYFHAPIFHPAMRYVAPVRKALKVKTFFNMLGPMTNPARPKNQFVGVFNEEVQNLYSEVCKLAGINFGIVYSLDGYDEISLTGDFKIVSKNKSTIYSPSQLKLTSAKAEDLHGGDTVEEAAAIFTSVLTGKGTKTQNEVVIANSAFALSVYFPDKNLDECFDMAQESLFDKKALTVFQNFFNQK